jgi:predicted hydrolase (HD superfamily)
VRPACRRLLACDEITGLITAVTLVRPSRAIGDVTVKSIKNKWKDKAFAAGAKRDEIEEATKEFGMDLWEHAGNVLAAMQANAEELGLKGNPTGT